MSNLDNNPFFGWILKENPNFWEDNGYKKVNTKNFHYYGCTAARVNNVPVYKKQLYIDYDSEEESSVELFRCEYGVVCHNYIVAIHEWNNAGDIGCPLKVVTQVSTIDAFNKLIMEYLGGRTEGGSYLLERNPKFSSDTTQDSSDN